MQTAMILNQLWSVWPDSNKGFHWLPNLKGQISKIDPVQMTFEVQKLEEPLKMCAEKMQIDWIVTGLTQVMALEVAKT